MRCRPLTGLLAMFLLVGCPGEANDDDSSDEDNSGDDDTGDDDTGEGGEAPVPVDIPLPSSFTLDCTEASPDTNDIDVIDGKTSYLLPPWSESQDCGTVNSGSTGPLLHVAGSIRDIVWDSWDGDNDTYSFVVEEGVRPWGVLRWDPLQGDLDAQLWCPGTSDYQQLFGGSLATADLAESGEAIFDIEAGSTCWLFVVGYSGLVAQYDFWLQPDNPAP